MSELKPVRCGCGGEAKIVNNLLGQNDLCLMECQKCGICTNFYNTEAEAIQAWNKAMVGNNTNVPSKEKTGEWIEGDYTYYHCSECGFEYDKPEKVSPYCPQCGTKMENDDD